MKKLGFGCMRMALLDRNNQESFNYPVLNDMADAMIKNGFEYFDTAYMYHNGKSECAVNNFLVKRHKRSDFKLADKMPLWNVKKHSDLQKIFDEQLSKCGVEFFDYYLLHCLEPNTYNMALEFDAFDFVAQKKAEGKVKKIGFSFHGTAPLLEEILTKHKGLDFVQLQINYIDWNDPVVQSGDCHAVARSHNLPIIVMEPIKGGSLVNLPDEAVEIMKKARPDMSVASWAIRFAAGQEGVFMVLSGMGAMEQMDDNISYMKDFKPLDKEELEVIEQVVKIINKKQVVPCTSCRYCVESCPKNIAIPDYFGIYNSFKTSPDFANQHKLYKETATQKGRAADCIRCKKCESLCPQHIVISERLKGVSRIFDK